ncbi:TolC family protein [Polynucleobacter sp. MWH-Svant-W18]|uniref:TolC family protein n=1 Tax=Polynucleobacter sp. MWH-Svant-W18 TaxID=1855909 RepID=UPI00203C9B69|nr:TolC family protein [Polynucleobacter sp. MWH-Svant-W18]
MIKSNKNNSGHTSVTGFSVRVFAFSFCCLCAVPSLAQSGVGSVQVLTSSDAVMTPPTTESYLPKAPPDRRMLADSKTINQKTSPNTFDLRQLWNELRSNNPQLIAARETYLAAKATVPQIAAPDNPQVGLIWSGMPVGSAFALGTAGTNPAGNSGYSFAQPIKFPGKKSLASDIADKGAEALQAQNENLYLQLGAQLSTLYFSTLSAQRQLQVLSDTVIRTELIKNIAKARYSNHAAAYVEYLNAQVAQSSAESDKFILEKQLTVAYKNINALIGRDPRDKLILASDHGLRATQVPTLIELENYAEGAHPVLKSSGLQLEAAKKGVTLAKTAYLPDFQVVASSYTPRGPFTSNNGAAYYQFEVDLVIPLYFFTKERYGVEQAMRSKAAAEASDISNRQQVILGVGTAYAAYEQAKRYTEFLKDRQVPQAEAAYRVALAQYASNGAGFTDLLTAQVQLRSLEIQLAIAQSNLLQSKANLFAAAGKDPID